MPRSHLFEVDGVDPPRKISKLSSLRYRALRKGKMPLRVARPPSGRAVVSQTHPAATAAAAAARVEAAADKINGGKFSTPTSRDSPSRATKTLANEKISEIFHRHPRADVAVEAPNDVQATAGVLVDFADAVTGVSVLPCEIPLVAALPPLWNAWWCGACTALHFVGDGGELIGPCQMCQLRNPIRNHVMLDPDEREELRRTPGLSYQQPGSGVAYPPPSRVGKTSGMSLSDSQDSSSIGSEGGGGLGNGDLSFSGEEDDYDFVGEKTDQEVSKYSFYDRLKHYMEREMIKEENRKSVELAVMVEAGSNVREMGVMTKELRANRFHSEYVSILADIPDSRFGDDGLRASMQNRFKGMRKGEMTAENLLRKYEGELTTLRRFAYKFPGVGNLSKLPSGTAQLQQLRKPLVAKLWIEKNPVCQVFVSYLARSLDSRPPHVHYLQGKLGLNYDDPVAVNEEIPYNWWLVDESCKYILSVLVHKDNKDLSTRPAKQPPGPTRAAVREKKTKETEKERSAAKAQRPIKVAQPDGLVEVEKYGDVDHQAKKAKVDGMRSVIDKNRVDAIMSQISVMRGLEEIYISRMGREEYERRLVNLVNQMPGMIENSSQGNDLFTP